jgi:DNA-binding XRE family transcriptional regulator
VSARTRNRVNGIPAPDLQAALPPVTAERVELLGLGVLVNVMERLTLDERRRALAYLGDRFGRVVVPAHVHIVSDPTVLLALLAAKRRVAGISQQELAKELGTTQSAVSEWETGKSGISGVSLFAIADVLDCDLALVPRGGAR